MIISLDLSACEAHFLKDLFAHIIEKCILSVLALLAVEYLVLASCFVYFDPYWLPIYCKYSVRNQNVRFNKVI